MASEHGSRAHSSNRESKRKRDRLIGLFKPIRSTVATSTEPQISKSEQPSMNDTKPSSSEPAKVSQVSLDSQSSSRTQSLPRTKHKSNHETKADEDGSQSQYLWMRAYKALENQNPGLVAAYACHLDPARNSPATPAPLALSPKLIQAVIERKLQDNEADKLVLHLGTESIKLREQGEKIVKFILWSNGFISAAVSAQPYAALAWSGVSVLLPLLLNSSKQKEAMLRGLSSVTDLLLFYKIREELYLQAVDESSHRHPDFVKAIVELYTDIFKYQATLVLHLSQSSFKRSIQSTFELDDWSGMLERVQSSDARCREYTALFDKEREHQFYMEQSYQIEQSIEVQKRISEILESSQDARQQDRRNDEETKLLRTLASNYKSDKDSISRRVPGTCKWVFEDKRFLDWRNSKNPSLLWISAGPGCGKSVLSRCLIDEKRLCTSAMTSTICYFFFKDGQEQRSQGANAISAILHQLFEKRSSSFLTHAISSYNRYGEKLQGEFSELWDILIKSARDPDAGEIVCVLDALDECEEDARKQLVEKLVGFVSETKHLEKSSVKLKFLITSRPYDDLELGFQPISDTDAFTRFDADDKSKEIGQEIHLVIDAKVPYIAGDFSTEDRGSISDRLKRLDNRTYLWLFLTINIIERSRSKYGKMSSIHELLSGLPSSVSDAYEKILSRSSDKDNAKILLQIVVAARRPLSLEEANIALSIATQRESCKSSRSLEALELWPSTSFKTTIQNMCGLFISVYDSKIFLIHQTAREFLLSSSASSSHEWEGSLNMASAHGTISQVCLHYLNSEDFATSPQGQVDWEKARMMEKQYPFLTYAAKEWTVHYTSQDSELAQSSRKAAGMLCRSSVAQPSYWLPIYYESSLIGYSSNWTDLGLACRLGLFYVVEDFLNQNADINATFRNGTALICASNGGHQMIVEMLLNQNADVNAESRDFGTALIAAAAGGHEKIVEMLLNQNADINVVAQSGWCGTALIAAAVGRSEKIVEMLLNQNADINVVAKSGWYGTALIAAAAGGSEEIAQMLLNHNADVNFNPETGDYGTALIAAAAGGREKIVEMFLNQNTDVNFKAETGNYGTALIAAAATGREKIVEMLLNQNADVNGNAKTGDYGNALIAAAAEGSEKIVEMLLNQNADVNSKAETGNYGTALIAASATGHEKIVQMLLNQNADVNVVAESERYGSKRYGSERYGSERYGTALIAASAKGREKIVEMLLNQNADVNSKAETGNYGTALIAASATGHEKIVQMLLNQNADVNVVAESERYGSERYGTALIAASAKGREKIVEMLLNQNADVNSKAENGNYGTALIAASATGHEKIVQMLLNQNADVNVNPETGDYGNALMAGAAGGSEKIVEMLLNQNADVNSKAETGNYGTALIAASATGHEKIVQMLLNQNADVNVNPETGDYGNALIAAAARGREKIVEMLLNQNADVNFNAETGSYGNALIAAAAGRSEKIVEMLLNQNADVNFAETGDYGTALIAASAGGSEKIVKMLLNQNADVNFKAETGNYGTALIAASAGGYENVVEILLERNATAGKDVALEKASARGREKVIEILLKRSPDIDFKGDFYSNVLQEASCNLHVGSVEILLNQMMDSNVEAEACDKALEVALKAAVEAEARPNERYWWNKELSDREYNAMIRMLEERKRKLSAKSS